MKIMWIRNVALVSIAVAAACGGAPAGSATEPITMPADTGVTMRADFAADLAGWEVVAGTWEPHGSGAESVLVQTATDTRYPVVLWNGGKFSDVDVTVRFKPTSGKIDASGGIIFRARDGGHYYVVRANSLENNFRLYTVVDGHRRQIASTRVVAPALGQWHTLRVVAAGERIQAYLNGDLLLDHTDTRFTTGRVGLWTKADAITEFADLVLTGVPEEGN